eukprot:UN17360
MFSTLAVIINDFSSCDTFVVLIHVSYKKCTSCVQIPKIYDSQNVHSLKNVNLLKENPATLSTE